MDGRVTENTGYYGLDPSPTTMNTVVATDMDLINKIRPILSAEVHLALVTFLAYAVLFVALAGVVSNILVIITCTKIGFLENINISYLALGISDLLGCAIRAWGAICYVFVVTNTKLPFDPSSLSVTTGFFLGQVFEKITAFITAFIALERCLCVQFPLHVKSIVTKRKTIVSMVVIYVFGFGPSNLIHAVYPFRWIFSPAQNRTILAMVPLQTSFRFIVARALLAYYGTILHFTALIIVWICTVFLAVGLKRKADTRKENFKLLNSKEDKRDLRVIKTVFLIAITYLACSTPAAATLLVPHFEPEFSGSRGLARISRVCHMFSGLTSVINSSVNFFIFLYMGSRFRQTFMSLFRKTIP
ncbi:chemosensory receptor a [Plakobranchus ocellatus]|uniref:Chemosensory receptor a n=1 Tax=Plakobranchus ocellatus TaxID=259542 RepID=A0AAV4BIG3_9GAST|nr:chemosensory receptor a [Plakobranchus ocellatus]